MPDSSHSLFGIPLFEMAIDDFAQHQDALVEFAYKIKGEDQGISRSNKKGWHSKVQLHHNQDPELQWLMAQIIEKSVVSIRRYEQGKPSQKIGIVTSWLNINPAGGWNTPHMHLPAEWSGVVYIRVKEQAEACQKIEEGDIVFFNPSPYGRQYNSRPTISFTPKNGSMFLFPGYLLHMVAPHFEEEERISLAFNFRKQQGQQRSPQLFQGV